MVRAAILILTCIQLSLVEGLDANPVKVKNETATDSTRRILFGQPTSPSRYPFMVKVRLNQQGIDCGGAIIANHWIMTAAHCSHRVPCNGIRILPGVWPNGQSVYVSRCYHHERFRPGTFDYDISLLRVEPDILQDGRAAKVPLPSPGTRFPPGTPATLLGWGTTEQGTFPRQLLYANVVIENWDTCNVKNKLNNPICNGNANCPVRDIPISIVCTQGLSPSPSSNCYGDSGGPLIVNGLAVGVFSFLLSNQAGRCIPGSPSMFTNVVEYLPWIFNIVGH